MTVLAPGQRVVVSTPYQAPALEVSRKGDELSSEGEHVLQFDCQLAREASRRKEPKMSRLHPPPAIWTAQAGSAFKSGIKPDPP